MSRGEESPLLAHPASTARYEPELGSDPSTPLRWWQQQQHRVGRTWRFHGDRGTRAAVFILLLATVIAGIYITSTHSSLDTASNVQSRPVGVASAVAGNVGGSFYREDSQKASLQGTAPAAGAQHAFSAADVPVQHGLSRSRETENAENLSQNVETVQDSGSGSHNPRVKPNIFFFLIDDMGWNDIGYQSTDLSAFTPNLDRLARNGIKLTNYYSSETCTPARASLMTGRYPVRYGLQYDVIEPGERYGLSTDEKLLPEYLKDAGYESHMVGKWHLGMYREEMMPQSRGFETFLGYTSGATHYWTHRSTDVIYQKKRFYDFGFGNQTSYYDVAANVLFVDDDDFDTALVDDGEASWPRQQAASQASWVDADVAPHRQERGYVGHFSKSKTKRNSNYNAPSLAAAMKRDVMGGKAGGGISERAGAKKSSGHVLYDEGTAVYDEVFSEDVFLGRATRIIEGKSPWDEEPLFLYVAHQAVHGKIIRPPADAFSEEEKALVDSIHDSVDYPERRKFASCLLYLDKLIGAFVHNLEEKGWMENSLIVVASDNGGCPTRGGTNYPLRGEKTTYWEGGVKVPAFMYSTSHIPEERWGTTYRDVMHVTDWLPTLASAVGVELTGSAGALDGVDHWSALMSPDGSSEPVRTDMLYNWDSYALSSRFTVTRDDNRAQGAFRHGKWKIIRNLQCDGYHTYDLRIEDPLRDPQVICPGMDMMCTGCVGGCIDPRYPYLDYLFNLEEDPRETTNLIEVHPKLFDRLLTRAEEVVFSEFSDSAKEPFDDSVYDVWTSHGWWICPWWHNLEH